MESVKYSLMRSIAGLPRTYQVIAAGLSLQYRKTQDVVMEQINVPVPAGRAGGS